MPHQPTSYESALEFTALKSDGLTAEQVAARYTGLYSKSYINNCVRVMARLHPTLKELWRANVIDLKSALRLIQYADQVKQWNAEKSLPKTGVKARMPKSRSYIEILRRLRRIEALLIDISKSINKA